MSVFVIVTNGCAHLILSVGFPCKSKNVCVCVCDCVCCIGARKRVVEGVVLVFVCRQSREYCFIYTTQN